MKQITIESNELISLLQPLEVVANPSHIVPIFRCVNLSFTGKKLIATVDNQEVRCESIMKLKTDFKHDMCTDFAMLNMSIKSLKGLAIELTITDKQLKVKHSKGDFAIPLEDSSVFPESKVSQLDKSAMIDTVSFKESLKIGTRFLLDGEMEPVSNLLIEVKKKKTIIRATNRVSLYQHEIKGGGDASQLLISGKTASIMNSLLDSSNELTEVKFNDSLVYFDLGNKVVTAVMQNGNFPLQMFNTIMETIEGATSMQLKNNADLVTGIKRVSTLIMKEKDPTIVFKFEKGNLNLSCENKSISSSSQENIKVEFAEDKRVGFNSKLISEVLSVFEKDADFSINSKNCFCIRTKKTSGLLAPLNIENE